MQGFRRAGLGIAVVAFGLVFSTARPAAAEWFLDVYGGVSMTDDADVTVRDNRTFDDKIEFDAEGMGGGRLGFYFLPWLGLAVDVSYFAPAGQGSTVETRLEVVPISPLLMVRIPLLDSPQFPNGRLQPYIGGGPGIFLTSVKVDVPGLGEQNSEWQVEIGGDFRAGVAFMFTPGFGTFVEGRYTLFSTNPGGRSTDIDVQTLHVMGGFTFRW